MHDTKIVKKSGEVIIAPLWKVLLNKEDFGKSTLKLIGHDPIAIEDMESAITYGVLISISKIGDQDEIERLYKTWEYLKEKETENG